MVASLAVDHKYQIDYSNFENTSFTKQVKNFGVQSTGAIFTKRMLQLIWTYLILKCLNSIFNDDFTTAPNRPKLQKLRFF